MKRSPATLLLVLLLGLLHNALAFAAGGQQDASVRELLIGERAVQVWQWQPGEQPARGVILFSHGASSAPWKYEPLFDQWLEAGYEIRAPLHVDSTDHPRQADFPGMASWKARLEDMQALSAELGEKTYIAAGHSYGALLALTLGGAEANLPEGLSAPLADPKATVVLAFSPPPTLPGLISKEGYSTLARPALIQTGTLDIPMSTDGGWEPHLDAYEAAASGGERYGLVLEGVDHYFGGAICRPELPGPKQLAQLETAGALSLLMIHGLGEGDGEARKALDSAVTDQGPTVLMHK
ncbi:alpha/beta hydrolase [Parahaliea maris]|uniref:Alpha/beta hydrolase n=1 Tax=Parahaliea maris TaxID=2716870 RepID=A0A5C8ZXP1_9GAMM|nr:alpha/beta fold hydrolase [Parahaliea maris]TXS91991.1 alpha/beta hydrolase [Parahaliea maris]